MFKMIYNYYINNVTRTIDILKLNFFINKFDETRPFKNVYIRSLG